MCVDERSLWMKRYSFVFALRSIWYLAFLTGVSLGLDI